MGLTEATHGGTCNQISSCHERKAFFLLILPALKALALALSPGISFRLALALSLSLSLVMVGGGRHVWLKAFAAHFGMSTCHILPIFLFMFWLLKPS